jgi:hypothetical protein
MTRVKTAQLIFCIAALLFIAKPFVGFGLSGHLQSPVKTNILAKVFSKRKVDDGRSSMNAIQKQLADPATNLFLRFAFLLAILFPLAFKADELITAHFINQFQLRLQPQQLNLFTGQLLI